MPARISSRRPARSGRAAGRPPTGSPSTAWPARPGSTCRRRRRPPPRGRCTSGSAPARGPSMAPCGRASPGPAIAKGLGFGGLALARRRRGAQPRAGPGPRPDGLPLAGPRPRVGLPPGLRPGDRGAPVARRPLPPPARPGLIGEPLDRGAIPGGVLAATGRADDGRPALCNATMLGLGYFPAAGPTFVPPSRRPMISSIKPRRPGPADHDRDPTRRPAAPRG